MQERVESSPRCSPTPKSLDLYYFVLLSTHEMNGYFLDVYNNYVDVLRSMVEIVDWNRHDPCVPTSVFGDLNHTEHSIPYKWYLLKTSVS